MGLGLIIQRRSHVPQGVAGMNRNRRPDSIGNSGPNASEYAGRAGGLPKEN
jgi:hypothetical protein